MQSDAAIQSLGELNGAALAGSCSFIATLRENRDLSVIERHCFACNRPDERTP
jgi:hypothetical protein